MFWNSILYDIIFIGLIGLTYIMLLMWEYINENEID